MKKEPSNKQLGSKVDKLTKTVETLAKTVDRGFASAELERKGIRMDIEDVSVSVAAAHDSITEMASDLKDIREDVREVKSAVVHHEGRILKLETKPA